MELLRPHDQIQVRQSVNELRSPVLSHATQDADHEIRVRTLPLCQVTGFPDRLLFCLITNATGIEQDYIRIEFVIHHRVATVTQGRSDLLAVPLIHLTSVGLDINAIHGEVGIKTGYGPPLIRQTRTKPPPKTRSYSRHRVGGLFGFGSTVDILFQLHRQERQQQNQTKYRSYYPLSVLFCHGLFNRRFPRSRQAVNPLAETQHGSLADPVKEDDARKDRIYADPLTNVGGFVFDESVANVFDDMIRRSVPGYAMTLSLMPLIAQRYAQKTAIYDLGCSLGAGLAAIAGSLPRGVFLVGIDNSQSMLDRCQANLQDAIPERKWSLFCSDILDMNIENASVVLLNFTLQFIPLENRLPLLSKIAKGLRPGGDCSFQKKFASKTRIRNRT